MSKASMRSADQAVIVLSCRQLAAMSKISQLVVLPVLITTCEGCKEGYFKLQHIAATQVALTTVLTQFLDDTF
jgi:hypothetical protein